VSSYLPILPTQDQFVPTYANHGHVDAHREKEMAGSEIERERERERENILSVYICHGARTIAGKIITVFTAERIQRARRQNRLLPTQARSTCFELVRANNTRRKFVNSSRPHLELVLYK